MKEVKPLIKSFFTQPDLIVNLRQTINHGKNNFQDSVPEFCAHKYFCLFSEPNRFYRTGFIS